MNDENTQYSVADNLDLSTKEVELALEAQPCAIWKLSLGQAASLADYSRSTSVKLLANYNYPFLIIQHKI